MVTAQLSNLQLNSLSTAKSHSILLPTPSDNMNLLLQDTVGTLNCKNGNTDTFSSKSMEILIMIPKISVIIIEWLTFYLSINYSVFQKFKICC